MLFSGALGKMIHEKNLKEKISPFKAKLILMHTFFGTPMCIVQASRTLLLFNYYLTQFVINANLQMAEPGIIKRFKY